MGNTFDTFLQKIIFREQTPSVITDELLEKKVEILLNKTSRYAKRKEELYGEWLVLHQALNQQETVIKEPNREKYESEVRLAEYASVVFNELVRKRICQKDQQDEFRQRMLLIVYEFFHQPVLKFLKNVDEQKMTIFGFIDDAILVPSFGFRAPFSDNTQGFVISSKPNKGRTKDIFPETIDRLTMVNYLSKNYTVPSIENKFIEFAASDKVTYTADKDIPSIGLRAEFNKVFWNNLFHSVDTCRFNFKEYSNASWLDSADCHINYLMVNPINTNKTRLPVPLALAILVDAVDKDKNKYLIVEGVWGETASKVGEAGNGSELFEYLYSCIFQYARKTRRKLFLNTSFNIRHAEVQSTPLLWANFIAKKRELPDFYKLNPQKIIYYNWSEPSDLKKFEQERSLWLIKEEDFFFTNQGFPTLRYLNTFNLYNKLKLAGERKKSQNYAVNKAEGFTSGVELNLEDLARDTDQRTINRGNQWRSRFIFGLGVITTVLAAVLAFSNQKKNSLGYIPISDCQKVYPNEKNEEKICQTIERKQRQFKSWGEIELREECEIVNYIVQATEDKLKFRKVRESSRLLTTCPTNKNVKYTKNCNQLYGVGDKHICQTTENKLQSKLQPQQQRRQTGPGTYVPQEPIETSGYTCEKVTYIVKLLPSSPNESNSWSMNTSTNEFKVEQEISRERVSCIPSPPPKK